MSRSFKILATSDIHGYVYPYTYSNQAPSNQGIAKLAAIISDERDENTIVIDNGDSIQGSPLVFYFNKKHGSEHHVMAEVMNQVGYDYVNLGNHDFNEGPAVLKRYIHDLNAECICHNVTFDGEYLSKPYVIHTFPNGARIALFGLVTQHLVNWEQPQNLTGLKLENAYDKAGELVKQIRENETVDAVVCVYHGGFEKDLKTGKPTELLNGENRGYDMCHDLDIDILISGHQHRSIAGECCGTYVTQTAYNGREIAKVVYDVEAHSAKCSLIPADVAAAPAVMAAAQTLEDECQDWLDRPLGHCEEDLLIHDGFQARLHKHPMLSFLNQVQFSLYPEADFSACALFNDAVGFDHDVSMRDVVSTYVYSNTTVAMRMSGHILKQYLERCAEYFELERGDFVVSPRFMAPKPSHFNYDMVDGLDYMIKVSNPIGERVIYMKKDGKDLDLDAKYVMLVSNYRAGGGGDFDMLAYAEPVKEIQIDMVEAIGNYILNEPEIHVKHTNNILVIK